jgi:hypothetical protein
MKIITYCYDLIDKFHIQNNQLSICKALALLDTFSLEKFDLDKATVVGTLHIYEQIGVAEDFISHLLLRDYIHSRTYRCSGRGKRRFFSDVAPIWTQMNVHCNIFPISQLKRPYRIQEIF